MWSDETKSHIIKSNNSLDSVFLSDSDKNKISKKDNLVIESKKKWLL